MTKDPRESESSSDEFNFYLVVTPGLEALALAELRDWAPALSATAGKAGVEFRAALSFGLELNRVLKIPTRILLRLESFACSDFPKLFKKVSNFPWTAWIDDSATLEFEASSQASRLKIKKRIEETCRDARRDYLKERSRHSAKSTQTQARAASAGFTVFVRFMQDICTLSLDTSGDRLHKRGLRPLSSAAPLRESIAAALLRFLEEPRSAADAIELVDPMTGGGTFLIEAALAKKALHTREFAYEKLKILRHRKEKASDWKCTSRDPYAAFTGFDINDHALEAARANFQLTGEKRPLSLQTKDVFGAEVLPPGRRWLIVNPPYGERLGVTGRLADFYERLFAACEKVAAPERCVFLLPETASPLRLKFPRNWRREAELRFKNGGLAVTALLFVRNVHK